MHEENLTNYLFTRLVGLKKKKKTNVFLMAQTQQIFFIEKFYKCCFVWREDKKEEELLNKGDGSVDNYLLFITTRLETGQTIFLTECWRFYITCAGGDKGERMIFKEEYTDFFFYYFFKQKYAERWQILISVSTANNKNILNVT